MKKHIAFTLIALLSGTAFAATTTSKTEVKTEKKSSFLKNAKLKLETEMASVRDSRDEVHGNETYYLMEPGYKLSKKTTIMAGLQYKTREAGGSLLGAEKANRDHMDEAYLKLEHKVTSFKTNGIADLTIQARAYSAQDDFFKNRYAADGNYQARAYFGRPLAGKLYINKYTSYLRYKNYFNNNSVTNHSRDYELRARISPTYTAGKGLDLGTTITYNHIFKVNKLEDEENMVVDLTARYQVGNFATLFYVGAPYLANNSGKDVLKINADAGKELRYALNFALYL